jgi:hypothetical protein
MATFEGRGGYVYEELSDGSFKIVKSPKSKGGQIVTKDDPIWGYINSEKREVEGGAIDRATAREEESAKNRKYSSSVDGAGEADLAASQMFAGGRYNKPASSDDGPEQMDQSRYGQMQTARREAARAASSKDTSPSAMAVQKSKTSPGAATPGSNRRPSAPVMDMGETNADGLTREEVERKALEEALTKAGGRVGPLGPRGT